MNSTPNRSVLLVGATGMLGTAITEAILSRPDLWLRVLVRPGKPDVAQAFRNQGVEVVEGDASDPASLSAAVRGVNVIVCALPNDPRIFVDGHRHLIEAGEQAGVARLFPSDFSVDYFKTSREENDNLAMRKEVTPLFSGRRIRPPYSDWGVYGHHLGPQGSIHRLGEGVLPYFGDGHQPCDFTSVRDAARVVAAACADPQAPETLRIAGDVKTMPELAVAISRGIGKSLGAQSRGSVDDLAAYIAGKKSEGGNPWEWIAPQYHHNMVSGRAKLDPLDNARYPDIPVESIEAFAARTGEGNARGMSRSAA
jgi:nucleoside-diphosphate-sugar epimerase